MPPALTPGWTRPGWQRAVGGLLVVAGAAVIVVLLLVVLPVPTAVGVLGAVAVLGAAAVLAGQDGEVLSPVELDRPGPQLPDRPLVADDLPGVRLSMAVRGYRMAEVDQVLDRVADELALRDARLAEQERRLADQDRELAEQGRRLAEQEQLFGELRARAARRDA